LENIANNLPKTFTDYKGVIKSHNPAANVPERVEVPTQNLPNQNKRWRNTVTKDKPPWKPRKTTSKAVSANQHHVDRHQLDTIYLAQVRAQIQVLGHRKTQTQILWEI